MKEKEYLDKTQPMVNFLMHIFSEDVRCVSTIMTAQAEQNTERLIVLLGIVKDKVEGWIDELNTINE